MKRFACFLTGAAMGATVAVLYAPQKGSETRKAIREKSEKGYELAVEKGKKAAEQGRAALHRGVEIADDAKQAVVRRVKTVAA